MILFIIDFGELKLRNLRTLGSGGFMINILVNASTPRAVRANHER